MKSLLLCLILVSYSAWADLDPHDEQGLKETQNLLKNSHERQQRVNQNEKARNVDNHVEALGGSKQNKEEMYDISSDVMEKLVRETNGDAEKMQKILEEARSNPEAFYNKYFDDKSKNRVRGVATDINKKGVPSGSSK